METIRTDTYVRMSHVTGPGCVLVSLRFGRVPDGGPVITVRSSIAKAEKPSFDLEQYVAEVLEGVLDANRLHEANLEVEEIQIVPDDYPTRGQVRHCAEKITTYVIKANKTQHHKSDRAGESED
ncbi:hypothetical protein JO972_02130 [Verrucomicrobiaceae bacterium 5K15]|uniref:hypothetical protein n=1 Tax=Oceaniferula flava TaxID=2800421 RepID=UPI001D3D0A9B|nr:hypothetical protein [Oceaniferula flavus]MBM1135050.1 hypothetical protein [Oceaniferula flavus]